MILLLLLLILIPITSYKWAKSHRPEYKFTILGISLGTIAAPFSLGLYATFFIPIIGLPTGILGLVMVMFHGDPGFQVAVQQELIPPGVVTGNSSRVIIALINAFIWGAAYGAIGYLVDKYRKHRQNPNKALKRDSAKNAAPLS